MGLILNITTSWWWIDQHQWKFIYFFFLFCRRTCWEWTQSQASSHKCSRSLKASGQLSHLDWDRTKPTLPERIAGEKVLRKEKRNNVFLNRKLDCNLDNSTQKELGNFFASTGNQHFQRKTFVS
jgi:hypothetical protein